MRTSILILLPLTLILYHASCQTVQITTSSPKKDQVTSKGKGQQQTYITSAAPKKCSHAEFRCIDNSICIPLKMRCDGVKHCLGGSDEVNCPIIRTVPPKKSTKVKREGQLTRSFQTTGTPKGRYGHVTHAPKMMKKETRNCTQSEHRCNKTGRCIPQRWLCDKDNDCGDWDDEQNCGHNYTWVPRRFDATIHYPIHLNDTKTCNESEFRCHYKGRCVSKSWVCDGVNDCGDWSDEKYCDSKPTKSASGFDGFHHFPIRWNDTKVCNESEFRCHYISRCVSISWVCDGVNDCGDWSDEKYCDKKNVTKGFEGRDLTRPRLSNKTGPCNETEYRCNETGRCIPQRWICDRDNDCEDWSDEINCDGSMAKCNETKEFRCPSTGRCIPAHRVCDRINDCEDGSDEKKCRDQTAIGIVRKERIVTTEKPNMNVTTQSTLIGGCRDVDDFKCKTSGRCILRGLFCNGVNDCRDRSDEIGCETTPKVNRRPERTSG